jgi:hypothetical protein
MASSDPTTERLEQQIEWYDRRSIRNQRSFKFLQFAEIAAGALVPLAAGLALRPLLTGGLGVLIVILEGVQQVNQHHHNWITYRSTCESLKHEKYFYLAKAGPCAEVADAHALLAERIESLISQEHAKWIAGEKRLENNRRKVRAEVSIYSELNGMTRWWARSRDSTVSIYTHAAT